MSKQPKHGRSKGRSAITGRTDTRYSGRTATHGTKGAPVPQNDEGIDYSDIPDVGDNAAFWTGGRVGPVLPVGPIERSN